MSEAPAPPIAAALSRAVAVLSTDPALAARLAGDLAAAAPANPRPALVYGMALRRLGDAFGARRVLEPLARAQPRAFQVHLELGLTLAALDAGDAALDALRHAVGINPRAPDAWRMIADLLAARGESAAADQARAEQIYASITDPALEPAADALRRGRLDTAERLLRARLDVQTTAAPDGVALSLLAEVLSRRGRHADAEAIHTRRLVLASDPSSGLVDLALSQFRQQKAVEALATLDRLPVGDRDAPSILNLRGACLALIGDHAAAIPLFQSVVARAPRQPRIWLSLGHAFRGAGRPADAIAAYDQCLDLAPGLGEAWWSLANLKTFAFSPEQVAAMTAGLSRDGLNDGDRLHLHYALGKALEDAGDFAASFDHYRDGARLRRAQLPYDADRAHQAMLRSKRVVTDDFLASRAGQGAPDPGPIFIVGLPRAGSTLVEQILASHSAVEGLMELPHITHLAREISRQAMEERGLDYPEALAALSATEVRALGDAYLRRVQVHRRLARPHFIDKMPNNFHHLGLISLILPKARIIDARRGAMACCFSAFKQHFAEGHAFSYDLEDLGRYYRDYVEIMDHHDRAAPGRVHRVTYETLVSDPESEIRRLLDYCGLLFEESCLRFHQTKRNVRTASSEQVRRPLYREGLDHWRNYEPWLDPLKLSLGPDLARNTPSRK